MWTIASPEHVKVNTHAYPPWARFLAHESFGGGGEGGGWWWRHWMARRAFPGSGVNRCGQVAGGKVSRQGKRQHRLGRHNRQVKRCLHEGRLKDR